MEHLLQLLKEIECISLSDISTIPSANQHVVVEYLEQLQDELKRALQPPQTS